LLLQLERAISLQICCRCSSGGFVNQLILVAHSNSGPRTTM
jgi:hypothetical protein